MRRPRRREVLTKDRVGVGDKAPDFALQAQSGSEVRLSGFLGKKRAVLYFYLKDFTPGCTKQACAFRDRFQSFQEAGAEVMGVSPQSVESHELFSVQHGLPFILLSDEGNCLRKLYGVPNSMGILPGRVTYVIDIDGVVRHIFSSQTDIVKHVDESLRALRSMTR